MLGKTVAPAPTISRKYSPSGSFSRNLTTCPTPYRLAIASTQVPAVLVMTSSTSTPHSLNNLKAISKM